MTQSNHLHARHRPHRRHRRMAGPCSYWPRPPAPWPHLAACSDSASRQFLSLGTAGTGGIYYPLGGAMAARLSISDTLRQYTAEVSGGSVENVNRLRERQTDLAFATGNTVFEAFSGGQDYPEPVSDLRILAPLYPNMTHIVVKRGSTATSLADLAGGVVSVGPPGSGTEQMSRQILEAYGLTYDDVTPRYLSFNESATALKDGAIDAAIISVGYPGGGGAGSDHHRRRAPPPNGGGPGRHPARTVPLLRPRRDPARHRTPAPPSPCTRPGS